MYAIPYFEKDVGYIFSRASAAESQSGTALAILSSISTVPGASIGLPYTPATSPTSSARHSMSVSKVILRSRSSAPKNASRGNEHCGIKRAVKFHEIRDLTRYLRIRQRLFDKLHGGIICHIRAPLVDHRVVFLFKLKKNLCVPARRTVAAQPHFFLIRRLFERAADYPVIRCIVINIAYRASAVLIAYRSSLHRAPHRRILPPVEQIFYLIPFELILDLHRYPLPCDCIISPKAKTELKKRPFRKKIVFNFYVLSERDCKHRCFSVR